MTDKFEEIIDKHDGFGVQNDGEPATSGAVAAEPEAPASPSSLAEVTEETPAPALEAEKAEETTEEGTEDAERKKRSGVQRLKMKLEREQAEKAALAARIAELENANKPQVAQKADGEPSPDDFDNYQDYSKALARYEAKQIIAEERKIEADRKRQSEMLEMQKAWEAKEAQAAAKYDDYDEVADVRTLASAGLLTPVMAEVVFTSDNGPDILHWIGSNPEDAQRIAGLTPARAALELGRISERLDASAKPTPKPKTSAAPPPISPLVAKGAAPAPSKFDRFEVF